MAYRCANSNLILKKTKASVTSFGSSDRKELTVLCFQWKQLFKTHPSLNRPPKTHNVTSCNQNYLIQSCTGSRKRFVSMFVDKTHKLQIGKLATSQLVWRSKTRTLLLACKRRTGSPTFFITLQLTSVMSELRLLCSVLLNLIHINKTVTKLY